ncbi:MAG: hypothetical protein ACPGOY_02260 [Rhodospirillaceae bacterium]
MTFANTARAVLFQTDDAADREDQLSLALWSGAAFLAFLLAFHACCIGLGSHDSLGAALLQICRS